MAERGDKVQLCVYDLSQGLARQLSLALLGKQVWHVDAVEASGHHSFKLTPPLTFTTSAQVIYGVASAQGRSGAILIAPSFI